MSKAIKVLVCRIGRAPVVEELQPDSRGGHLDAMQAIVGGLVECINLGLLYGNVDLWCNEEGRLLDLPLNISIYAGVQPPTPDFVDFVIYGDEVDATGNRERLARPGDHGEWRIHGNFFLCRVDDEGDCADVDDTTVERFTKWHEHQHIAAAQAMNAQRTGSVKS